MKMNVSFSKWIHFSERNKLEQLKCPGIYAIAYSSEDISGKDFDWIKEIVYFGMTNSKEGLRGRLRQFDNTIKSKSVQHDPVRRFCFNLDREDANWGEKLYVSVMPVPCDVTSNSPEDLICMGEVAKQEYVCFAEYVKKYGAKPRFNDEKRSPKQLKIKNK
jgi:hypothetical protein